MKKAFTMMELIFVIVVIGILAAIVIPRTGSNKLQEAATQVISHIRYTQHLAMVEDKFDVNDPDWWQERWQIRFPHTTINGLDTYYYEIFSDKNHQGNSDASEEAKDPLTGNNIGNGNSLVTVIPDDALTNLAKKYNITSVTGTCQLGGAYRTVAFDFIGRPYLDVYTKAYDNPVPSPNGCTIILNSSEGNATIKIHPESGYACVLDKTNTNCL
ncbi:MAG TPA: type II secretion system protein [Sulfurimonas sp.]|uniref:pilus assembly FimT family protein n=1 Tax=Sulfurimonas sp. TaxID=2022749 RepID=UPI002BD2E307|nr:type II secretion system protein [Sulfurimonas sp.]HUH42589.1 type II secretion system protein [Sulfurimonas sp.]